MALPGRRPTVEPTVAEFRASLGDRGHLLSPVLAALGLPSPDDHSRLGARDEELVEAFIRAWDIGLDPDVAVRAARLVGEGFGGRWTAGWGCSPSR